MGRTLSKTFLATFRNRSAILPMLFHSLEEEELFRYAVTDSVRGKSTSGHCLGSSARNWNMGKGRFGHLFLRFRFHFLHVSFTAHWNTCGFTSAHLINDQNKPTLFALVFGTVLCHLPSPPRDIVVQKLRVTPRYETIQITPCCLRKGKNRLQPTCCPKDLLFRLSACS